MDKSHIKEIAKSAGGVIALSIALGLSRSAVSQWKRVPIERIRDVERITGIPRHLLRPEVFGTEQPTKPKASA